MSIIALLRSNDAIMTHNAALIKSVVWDNNNAMFQ